MVALLIGIIFIAFAVVAVWPDFLLNWWQPMLEFLKGGVPVFAMFVGLIAVFIGIADIKDRIEARKEEAEEQKANAAKSE
jgi:hypothetical protein